MNIENLNKEGRADNPEVRSVIKEEKLPLYQQAANESGFRLDIVARAGQQHSFLYTDRQTGKTSLETVKVGEGRVGVSIIRPSEVGPSVGHSPFWRRVEALDTQRR